MDIKRRNTVKKHSLDGGKILLDPLPVQHHDLFPSGSSEQSLSSSHNIALSYEESKNFEAMSDRMNATFYAVLRDTTECCSTQNELREKLLRCMLSIAILCERVVNGFRDFFSGGGKLTDSTCLTITNTWRKMVERGHTPSKELFDIIIQSRM
jgi:hypothetical protein